MAIYFCIGDVLDRLENQADSAEQAQNLTVIATDPPECGGFPEDAFILPRHAALLDLNDPAALSQLARLIDTVPLYRLNMELALDAALSERHGNTTLQKAIQKAFKGETLPSTLHGNPEPDDLGGNLSHPMIEHIDNHQLSTIYIDMLKNLDGDQTHYSFERNILGKHEQQFTQQFDGFIMGSRGKAKADILINAGMRLDHDPQQPLEGYVMNGQKQASAMNIEDPRELVWAWLEADQYQRRRCHDIHRVKMLENISRNLKWVRSDIFSLLEKEAAKQHFAATLQDADPGMALLAKMPNVKKAVTANAGDHVDDLLQQLLSQTLNLDTPYSGAAGKFEEAAARRAEEARREKFI